jgi:hypothetical protein
VPWKIREILLKDEHPVTRLWDRKNRIFMDIEMSKPLEVHLYIGNEDPERSRLYLVVDAEGILISRGVRFRVQDVVIMDSILGTMGYDKPTRKAALKPLQVYLNTRREDRDPEGVGSSESPAPNPPRLELPN